MIVVGVLREEWAKRRIVLQDGLAPNVVLRFGSGTTGRLTWPKNKVSSSSQEMQ
jgi:hypothetical protein